MAEKLYIADKPTLDATKIDTADTRKKVTKLVNSNGAILGADGNFYCTKLEKPDVIKSAVAGGTGSTTSSLQSIAISDRYVFAGSFRRFDVFNKGDLSLFTYIAISAYGTIEDMCLDENFIYIPFGYTVYKYDLNNLNLVASVSFDNNYLPQAIDEDEEYLYVGGFSNTASDRTLEKFRKSDLSPVASSLQFDNFCKVKVKGDFVYATSRSGQIRKFDKDLNSLLTIKPYTDYINGLDADENDVYAGVGSALKIYKQDDLSERKSVIVGFTIQSVKVDLSHIYVGGTNGELRKYDKNLKLIDSYDTLTGEVQIATDSNHLFAAASRNVRKYDDPLRMTGYERK